MVDMEDTPPRKGARFLQEIVGLKTQFDMLRFMRRLAESFGARAFMVLSAILPMPAPVIQTGITPT